MRLYFDLWIQLNAEHGTDKDLVISQAQALDGLPHTQRGPLHGVAVGTKDVMNMKVH